MRLVFGSGGDRFRYLDRREVAFNKSNLLRTPIPPNRTKRVIEIEPVLRTTGLA